MNQSRSILMLSLACLLPASAAAAPPRGQSGADADALRQTLSGGDSRGRVSAARALGRMGDQQARPLLVAMLRQRDRRLVRAAAGSLRALDRARGEPQFLVAVRPQDPEQSLQRRHGPLLDRALRQRLERSFSLVLSGGEESVLSRAALGRHLRWRKLSGMAVVSRATCKPPSGSKRIVVCKVHLLLTTLRSQKMLFASESEARVSTNVSPLDPDTLKQLERQALTASAEAAAAQVASYLEQQ